MAWGEGKGGATSSPLETTSQLAWLVDLFALFPQCGAWSQAKLASIYKMNFPAMTLPLKIDIEK